MQTSSLKYSSLFSFALTALVIIFMVFFKKYLQIKFYGLSTALLLVVFGSYFLVYKSVKNIYMIG